MPGKYLAGDENSPFYTTFDCQKSGSMLHYISEILERGILCHTLRFIENSARRNFQNLLGRSI